MSNPIIIKIQKLMALAQNNANEAEAEAAAGKVQELLTQYNLDLAEVKNVAGPTASPADSQRIQNTHQRGAMYEYQQQLWRRIAETNFCWYWTLPIYKENKRGISRQVTRHHVIVGREENVMATRMMGDYLEETINRLCPYQGRECLSRSAISWKSGCAERLGARLWQRRRDLEERSDAAAASGAANTTAVALRNVYTSEHEANYDFLYGVGAYKESLARIEAMKNKPKLPEPEETESQRIKREAKEKKDQERFDKKFHDKWANRDRAAWRSGYEKGKDIGLDPQVSANKGERSIE